MLPNSIPDNCGESEGTGLGFGHHLLFKVISRNGDQIQRREAQMGKCSHELKSWKQHEVAGIVACLLQ